MPLWGNYFKQKVFQQKNTPLSTVHLLLEEVPVKWMDRPSATEMERGRASEMDRRKSAKKHGNATEINQM